MPDKIRYDFFFIKKMVKYKKKYYKKKKATKGQFNYIASNYFKAKLSISKRIIYDATQCRFIPGNLEVLQLYNLMAECPDLDALKKMFLSYKLTGIAIMAIPCPVSQTFNNYTAAVASETMNSTLPMPSDKILSAVCLAIISQSDGTSYNDLVESDKSLLLNFNTITRKYYKFNLSEWLKFESANALTGRVAVNTLALPTAGGLVWNVKFDFYITCKVI